VSFALVSISENKYRGVCISTSASLRARLSCETDLEDSEWSLQDLSSLGPNYRADSSGLSQQRLPLFYTDHRLLRRERHTRRNHRFRDEGHCYAAFLVPKPTMRDRGSPRKAFAPRPGLFLE
jgi:hypothetical protein